MSEAHDQMIQTVEEVLQNLRTGKTQALAIAEVFASEGPSNGRSLVVGQFADYPRMIGHVEWLKAHVFDLWASQASGLQRPEPSPVQSEGASK